MKLLKNKGWKMKNKFLIGFGWGLLFAVAAEITNYFVEHNMLDGFYVLLIELMFLGLGALSVILENKLKETKKGIKK